MYARMTSIDWGILIVAGASLIFAFIAFRQVMHTSAVVQGFVARADTVLKVLKDPKKLMPSPDYVVDVITKTFTKDLHNEDGSPVTMPQAINCYVQAYGPGLKAEFKAELPKLIPYILNPGLPPGHRSPGQALAEQRWGSGGLNAAKALSKAGKKIPIVGKIAEYAEGAQALAELIPIARQIKGELGALKGGDNGDSQGGGGSPSPSNADWTPPFSGGG